MKHTLRMCPPFCLGPDTKKCDMHEYTLDLSATDQVKAFRELTQQQKTSANRINVRQTNINLLFIYLLAYLRLRVNSF